MSPTDQQCRTAVVQIQDGPDDGAEVEVVLGPVEVSPELEVDQGVRLVDQAPAPGTPGADDADAEPTYGFSGVDRRTPLIILAVLFGLLGAFVARSRGVLALLGTGLSLSLVVLWLVPAAGSC